MSSVLIDAVLDGSLSELSDNVTTLYLTSALCTSFAQASSTYKLCTKSTYTVGAPADRTPSGRKVTCPAITNGVVNTTGTASHWALCSGSVLYAAGALVDTQSVTAGNTFLLDAFDIGIPDVA